MFEVEASPGDDYDVEMDADDAGKVLDVDDLQAKLVVVKEFECKLRVAYDINDFNRRDIRTIQGDLIDSEGRKI